MNKSHTDSIDSAVFREYQAQYEREQWELQNIHGGASSRSSSMTKTQNNVLKVK